MAGRDRVDGTKEQHLDASGSSASYFRSLPWGGGDSFAVSVENGYSMPANIIQLATRNALETAAQSIRAQNAKQ